jgi:negative regulator of flagellin synthesis FlgM
MLHCRAVSGSCGMPIEQVRRNTVEIRNNLNSLNPAANLTSASSQAGNSTQNGTVDSPAATGSDRATVSAVGNGIAQSSLDPDVRWEKVASISQALADGTYNVPTSAVASKMVDSMLGKQS